MRFSRHTFLTGETILIVLTIFLFCFAAGGHLHLDEEDEMVDQQPQEPYSSNQSPWRGKRMSQMSCHCCSNSFNSHCCLQCMRSVGKRSESAAPTNPFEDLPEDTFEEFASPENAGLSDATNDWTTNSLLCFCCILQMDRQPSSRRWSCCDKCPDRFNWIEKWNMKEKDTF